MSDSDSCTGIMLEQIHDQNKAVLEAVGQMQAKMETLATKDDLQVVADNVKTIKATLTATNRDLTDLDGRVIRLEQSS